MRYRHDQANRMPDDAGHLGTAAEFCGTPWLIVYGSGPQSEDIALAAAQQCRAEKIHTRVRPIDEIRGVSTSTYRALLAVLPSYSDDLKIRESLEPFARLVCNYRKHLPAGLSAIARRAVDPLDAGVISLAGDRVLLHHPVMRGALARACHAHELDQVETIDVFHPFRDIENTQAPRLPWDDSDLTDVTRDGLHHAWTQLTHWGITNPSIVTPLLVCIQTCCSYYDNPVKPQLSRPHPNIDKNRLQIILTDPDLEYGESKTWNENGARVWRYVLGQLQRVDPNIRRPGNPNAQGRPEGPLPLLQLVEDRRCLARHQRQRRLGPGRIRALGFMVKNIVHGCSLVANNG